VRKWLSKCPNKVTRNTHEKDAKDDDDNDYDDDVVDKANDD